MSNHSSFSAPSASGIDGFTPPISVADQPTPDLSHPSPDPDLQCGKGGGVQEVTVPTEAESSEATTLVLRNLPKEHNQQSVQEWVDNFGFAGLYDFLLFFPAKLTA